MSDIDFRDDESDSPLHWAVLLDNLPMVKFLLQNGADIRAKNKLGNNVVMIACINQRLEILRLLLNPLPKMTSLHAACLSGNVQIVKLLLENGADLFKWDHVS